MEQNRSGGVYTISVLVVTGMFALAALVLIQVGMMVYKNIAVSNLNTYELRTSLSYVATKVRQSDCESMLRLETREGVNMLFLCEEIEGDYYETAIYHYDGKLYEYYHEQGAEFRPEDGFEVLAVAYFDFALNEEGMLKLTAENSDRNAESIYLNIRSDSK